MSRVLTIVLEKQAELFTSTDNKNIKILVDFLMLQNSKSLEFRAPIVNYVELFDFVKQLKADFQLSDLFTKENSSTLRVLSSIYDEQFQIYKNKVITISLTRLNIEQCKYELFLLYKKAMIQKEKYENLVQYLSNESQRLNDKYEIYKKLTITFGTKFDQLQRNLKVQSFSFLSCFKRSFPYILMFLSISLIGFGIYFSKNKKELEPLIHEEQKYNKIETNF